MSTLTKLTSFPATKEQRAVVQIPAGFRLSLLGFKTVKIDGIESKRDSEAWIIPMLHDSPTEETSKIDRMIWDMIDDEQDSLLRGYVVASELANAEAIADLEKLAEKYLTDGRGNRTGVKQDQLMGWIGKELKAYLDSRILRNMPTRAKADRDSLVASLVDQIKIAASRGNKIGNRSLTLAPLEDLAKRLEVYSTDSVVENRLANSDELEAMQERISSHIAAIKAAADITVEVF